MPGIKYNQDISQSVVPGSCHDVASTSKDEDKPAWVLRNHMQVAMDYLSLANQV